MTATPAGNSARSAPSAPSAADPWRQFICDVCGLIYDEAVGDPDSGLPPGTRFEAIPDDWACPVCAVGKGDFRPYTAPPPPPAAAVSTRGMADDRPDSTGRHTTHNTTRHATRHTARAPDPGVLIVGAGRAGWQVAQALRELDADLPITLLSACNADVYDKPQLSVAIARKLPLDGLVREPASTAAQRLNLRLITDSHAVHIDAVQRRLRTSRGPLAWQHLVLAHGALPALPQALAPSQVWRINDLAAYLRLRAALGPSAQRIALIGAGLVGCELANDLALAGHAVTLLDVQDRPLAAQLPPEASARLLAAWQGLPIRFVGRCAVAGVDPARAADTPQPPGGAAPLRVRLATGDSLDVDQVIAATGLRAPSRLAQSAGVVFDFAAGGIAVDSATGATSQPGIYALGDCAVVDGHASRYIEPIARQARAIAAHITANAAPGSRQTLPDHMPAPSPLLRIKTSSLPITVSGITTGPGHWVTERDDAQALHMRRVNARGQSLATLVATAPSALAEQQ